MLTKTESTTVLPLIHLNGNSADKLQAQYLNAYEKLSEFNKAVRDIDFHPRDYYPIGDDAFAKATEGRMKLLVDIHNACQYLEEHVIHLQEFIK